MVEQVLPDLAEGSTIEEHPKGAIDIVVTERAVGSALLLAEPRMHYFECKHHGRPLELDTIAKTLVVGVREQPLSLNVVSSTRLLPQALDYAYAIFAGGDPSRPPMFRHPVFRHFTVGELITEAWTRQDSGLEQEARSAKVFELSWSLSECLPFMERTLATSDGHTSTTPVNAKVGSRYRLSILVPSLKKAENFEFAPATTACDLVDVRRSDTDGGSRIDIFVSFSAPTSVRSLGVFTLVRGNGALAAVTLALPVEVESFVPRWQGDVRGPRTQAAAERLARSSASRLTLIEGAAGVGKSFFCEGLATWLRTHRGFDADRFTIEAMAEQSLLERMLVSLFTPASARSRADEQLGAELADALLRRAAGSDTGHGVIGLELVIPVLVRGLASLGDRLLILRDCHLVSEASAKWIWLLASGLDDLGWGGVRLVLESRDPAGSYNPHWAELRQRLCAQIKSTCVERLEPLDRAELATVLEVLFRWIDTAAVETLLRRTGGYPLLLMSHLRALEARGVLAWSEEGRWLIRSPGAFSQASELEVAGQAILKQHLSQIDWRAVAKALPTGVTPMAALGLVAALGEQAERTLGPWLGFDDHSWEAVLAALENAAIIRRDERCGWSFAHDLMRGAALEAAASSNELDPIIMRLAALAIAEPVACEPIGDAAAAAGQHSLARRLFNAAHEHAVRAEDFSGRLRIIRKLDSSSALSPENIDIDTRLAIRNELGWAEWTAGSLLDARSAYDSIATEALASVKRGFLLREASHRAADGRRRSMGVSLELADWKSAVDAASHVFELGASKASIASTLNRLVQACARLDLPELGLHYAAIAAPYLGPDAGENAAAVLATDVSHLYLAACPELAVELLERGLELSESTRQRTFGRLNLMTAKFALTGVVPGDEAEILRSEIAQHGYVTMRARLDLLLACYALRNHELSLARILLDQAEMTVALYGQNYLEPALRNAELVWSHLKGDSDLIATNVTKAMATRHRWIMDKRRVRTRLKVLVSLAKRQAMRFTPDPTPYLRLPSVVPRFSGVGRHLAENLNSMLAKRSGSSRDGENVDLRAVLCSCTTYDGLVLVLPPH